MISELKISKGTCEAYYLRYKNDFGWADIYIDTNKGSEYGSIMIRSDYGDWSRHWSHCGSSFKEFIANVNDHYFMNKIAKKDYFDQSKVVNDIKKEIIRMRRNEDLTGLEARVCWNEAIDLDENTVNESSVFWNYFFENCEEINTSIYYNDSEGLPDGNDYQPGLYQFLNIWHDFQSLLKNELIQKKELIQ